MLTKYKYMHHDGSRHGARFGYGGAGGERPLF